MDRSLVGAIIGCPHPLFWILAFEHDKHMIGSIEVNFSLTRNKYQKQGAARVEKCFFMSWSDPTPAGPVDAVDPGCSDIRALHRYGL